MTERNPRRARSASASDMASERPEKPPNAPTLQQVIGTWEPPGEADRALVRDGLERNGAFDLAEMLGLSTPREAA
jgi:hypothetical protein